MVLWWWEDKRQQKRRGGRFDLDILDHRPVRGLNWSWTGAVCFGPIHYEMKDLLKQICGRILILFSQHATNNIKNSLYTECSHLYVHSPTNKLTPAVHEPWAKKPTHDADDGWVRLSCCQRLSLSWGTVRSSDMWSTCLQKGRGGWWDWVCLCHTRGDGTVPLVCRHREKNLPTAGMPRAKLRASGSVLEEPASKLKI